MTSKTEFKQYDDVFFNGVRSKIVSVNPISKTFNVRTSNSLAQNIEGKDLFASFEEWQAAHGNDPLVKPVDLLAWHKPPVAPRPEKLKPEAYPKTPDRFDYSQLAQEDQIAIRVQVSNIKTVMKRTAEGILQIGESLAEVQDHLAQYGHGKFQEWLKAEFEWSPRTAYRFIQVYKRLGVRANLAQMEIAASALYELADPETPDEVVDVVIGRAESGEPIERKDVIEVKQEMGAAYPEVGEQVSPLETPASVEPSREEIGAAEENTSSSADQHEISPQISNVIETPSEETAEPITTTKIDYIDPETGEILSQEIPTIEPAMPQPEADPVMVLLHGFPHECFNLLQGLLECAAERKMTLAQLASLVEGIQ